MSIIKEKKSLDFHYKENIFLEKRDKENARHSINMIILEKSQLNFMDGFNDIIHLFSYKVFSILFMKWFKELSWRILFCYSSIKVKVKIGAQRYSWLPE